MFVCVLLSEELGVGVACIGVLDMVLMGRQTMRGEVDILLCKFDKIANGMWWGGENK